MNGELIDLQFGCDLAIRHRRNAELWRFWLAERGRGAVPVVDPAELPLMIAGGLCRALLYDVPESGPPLCRHRGSKLAGLPDWTGLATVVRRVAHDREPARCEVFQLLQGCRPQRHEFLCLPMRSRLGADLVLCGIDGGSWERRRRWLERRGPERRRIRVLPPLRRPANDDSEKARKR
ncbi:MAG TPA: hypothetical protein VEH84_18610 [Alphaproteobacteria bacterium]|nr:hypothetical protein [Alphaproteobacteria bacterium]